MPEPSPIERLVLATCVLAAAPGAVAQTLPKGWDTTECVQVGTTTPSQFAPGFDLGWRANEFNPSRTMHLYAASEFPWDPTTGTTIRTLSFRRDGDPAAIRATAHGKDMVLILSTSDAIPAQANFNWFDGNHGTNRTEVFGRVGAPKSVAFPATPAPTGGRAAAFDVTVTLDTPFTVPANARCLVLEIRTYGVTGSQVGWWRSDSVTFDGSGYDDGSFRVFNSDHCVIPNILYNDRPATLGSNFGHIWRQRQGPGGRLLLTWIGLGQSTPYVRFPGSLNCDVYVMPPVFIKTTVSERSGATILPRSDARCSTLSARRTPRGSYRSPSPTRSATAASSPAARSS